MDVWPGSCAAPFFGCDAMKRRAFTLVELAIVIMVIGILLGIAVPQFIRSRAQSQMKTCLSSLRKIEEGKELWAIAEHQPANATCQMTDVVPNYVKRVPECPTGGTYTVGTLDEKPECTIGTGPFAHKL